MLDQESWTCAMSVAEAEQEENRIAVLETKNIALGRSCHILSRYLQDTLHALSRSTGLLEKDVVARDAERIRIDMARIAFALGRSKRLVDELLQVSNVEQLARQSTQVPLAVLAGEAVAGAASRIAQKDILVWISPQLPTVYGDRLSLAKIFMVLLDAAIEHVEDQISPSIGIGVRLNEQPIVCYVQDNGIRHQDEEEVLTNMGPADESKRSRGLDLALVRSIVEHHGGRIWVESGSGAKNGAICFTLDGPPR